MICDMWHFTFNMWSEGNILSQFQIPNSYGLGVKVFWKYLNKLMTNLLICKGVRRRMNILSKFQLPRSSGLGLTVFGGYFHKPSLTELINEGCDCRTAPATPGLLIIYIFDPNCKVTVEHLWRGSHGPSGNVVLIG